MRDERYKRYNSMTFETYCKTSIDHAISRGSSQKARRAQQEVSLSDFSDDYLGVNCTELEVLISEKSKPVVFSVKDIEISVYNKELAQALRTLTPQKRNILLLAYFLGKNDANIAQNMNLSRSAVQRRRATALEIMRKLMRGQK